MDTERHIQRMFIATLSGRPQTGSSSKVHHRDNGCIAKDGMECCVAIIARHLPKMHFTDYPEQKKQDKKYTVQFHLYRV